MLAGAILQPHGEFAVLECRAPDELRVVRMELEIGEPRKKHWAQGIKDRADILRQHL